MASHDLYDGHGRFIVIDRSVRRDLADNGGHIFGGAAVSRRMVGVHQVVVNGLWHADETDVASDPGGIAGKLAHRIHGVVSSDVEEVADLLFCKLLEEPGIDRILQVFRQFVAAGAKVSPRGGADKLQLAVFRQSFHVHKPVRQESFDSIYHTIDMSDLNRVPQSLGNHSVEAAVDNSGRSAGLSYDNIFLH